MFFLTGAHKALSAHLSYIKTLLSEFEMYNLASNQVPSGIHQMTRSPDGIDRKSINSPEHPKGVVISEQSHHRTKNILQNIISYLNIVSGIGGSGSLTPLEVQRVIRYVHGLANLQDFQYQDLLEGGNGLVIRLDRVFSNLLGTISHQRKISWHEIPPMLVSTRRAPNLLILLIEFIDLLGVTPEDEIGIDFALIGNMRGHIAISTPSNEAAHFIKGGESIDDTDPRSPWKIVKVLTGSDPLLSWALFHRRDKRGINLEFDLDLSSH